MWNSYRYESDLFGMKIELFQFGLCSSGEDKEDFMAFFSKFVGEMNKRGEMAHSKPWIHEEFEGIFTHFIILDSKISSAWFNLFTL